MLWSSFWLSMLNVEVFHGILDAHLGLYSSLSLRLLHSVAVGGLAPMDSEVVHGDLVLGHRDVTDVTNDVSPGVYRVNFALFVADVEVLLGHVVVVLVCAHDLATAGAKDEDALLAYLEGTIGDYASPCTVKGVALFEDDVVGVLGFVERVPSGKELEVFVVEGDDDCVLFVLVPGLLLEGGSEDVVLDDIVLRKEVVVFEPFKVVV